MRILYNGIDILIKLLAVLMVGTMGMIALDPQTTNLEEMQFPVTTLTSVFQQSIGYHIISLDSEISNESVEVVKQGIADAVAKKKELFIKIDSPGGDVVAEMTITALLRQSPVKVTTFATGLAASAAAMILAAGDVRISSPSALLLTHYARHGMSGSLSEPEIREHYLLIMGINKTIENHYMNLLHMTREMVQQKLLHLTEDMIIDPQDALQMGLVTMISEDPLHEHAGQ